MKTDKDDPTGNNIVATGAVSAALGMGNVKKVEVVTTPDGAATNQVRVWFAFMSSPYLVTVERITAL